MVAYVGIDALPIQLISGDSKYKSLRKYIESGSTDIEELRGFFSCLSAGIVVDDIDAFNKSYFSAIEHSFTTLGYDGIDLNDRIFCSKDLNQFAEGENQLHESFIKQIKSSIRQVNVTFSSLNCRRIPEVKTMSRTRTPKEIHPKLLTLHYLNNSFPHINLWNIWKQRGIKGTKFFLDHFTAHQTNAWREIESEALKGNFSIEVLYKGDQVNPLISASDILLKLIEKRIEAQRGNYDWRGIKAVLPEFVYSKSLFVDEISPKHYPYITPREKKLIALKRYIKHPVFFIIPPLTKMVDVEFLLDQPNGTSLLKKVYQNQGCVKIFSKDEDKHIIKNGDFLVYIDDEGKKAAETINTSGLQLNVTKF